MTHTYAKVGVKGATARHVFGKITVLHQQIGWKYAPYYEEPSPDIERVHTKKTKGFS
jgi:hypothetical protein